MLFEPYKVNMTEDFCILTGPYGEGVQSYLYKFARFCSYACGTCYEDLPKWEETNIGTQHYRGFIEKKNYNIERFHFEDTMSMYKTYSTFRELLIMMMDKCNDGKVPYIQIGDVYLMLDKPPKVDGYIVTVIEL